MHKKQALPKYRQNDKVEFYNDAELHQENPPIYKGEIIQVNSNEAIGYMFDKYIYVIDSHNCKTCFQNIDPNSKTIQVFETHIKGLIEE